MQYQTNTLKNSNQLIAGFVEGNKRTNTNWKGWKLIKQGGQWLSNKVGENKSMPQCRVNAWHTKTLSGDVIQRHRT